MLRHLLQSTLIEKSLLITRRLMRESGKILRIIEIPESKEPKELIEPR